MISYPTCASKNFATTVTTAMSWLAWLGAASHPSCGLERRQQPGCSHCLIISNRLFRLGGSRHQTCQQTFSGLVNSTVHNSAHNVQRSSGDGCRPLTGFMLPSPLQIHFMRTWSRGVGLSSTSGSITQHKGDWTRHCAAIPNSSNSPLSTEPLDRDELAMRHRV